MYDIFVEGRNGNTCGMAVALLGLDGISAFMIIYS